MISLGINYSEMHDSAACIARDGHILFAIAEERLSRLKHDARFPSLLIEACLAAAGIRADQLDFVCFGWPPAIEPPSDSHRYEPNRASKRTKIERK